MYAIAASGKPSVKCACNKSLQEPAGEIKIHSEHWYPSLQESKEI